MEQADRFERLIELVLRRNVHVHNRGIVDSRYLDENKNIDRLNQGDVAVIESFTQSSKSVVRNTVSWQRMAVMLLLVPFSGVPPEERLREG